MQLTRRAFGIVAVGSLGSLPRLASAETETTLQKIRRTGKLTVATEAQFPPYEFVRDGQIVGFGRDVLGEVVKELGNPQLEQLDLPFQGILPGLLAEKFDFVATSLGMNPERARRYAFTLPLGESTPHFFKRRGDRTLSSLPDLNGKIVTTQLASSFEPTARQIDEQLKAAGGAGFKELKLFPAFGEVFLAVANRTADAGIAALPTLQQLLRDRPNVFEVGMRARGRPSYLAWATRPEDLDLRDFLNGVFRKLRASGRMAELQERWLGMRLELPETGYLPEGAI